MQFPAVARSKCNQFCYAWEWENHEANLQQVKHSVALVSSLPVCNTCFYQKLSSTVVHKEIPSLSNTRREKILCKYIKWYMAFPNVHDFVTWMRRRVFGLVSSLVRGRTISDLAPTILGSLVVRKVSKDSYEKAKLLTLTS